jgi:hypothetical protein
MKGRVKAAPGTTVLISGVHEESNIFIVDCAGNWVIDSKSVNVPGNDVTVPGLTLFFGLLV